RPRRRAPGERPGGGDARRPHRRGGPDGGDPDASAASVYPDAALSGAPDPSGCAPARSGKGGRVIRWLVGRTGRALLALAAIVTATFFMARLSGDPTALLLPDDAPEEARAAMRESLGLHRPLLEQFGDYLMGLIQGDAGTSYQYHRPVVELFLE